MKKVFCDENVVSDMLKGVGLGEEKSDHGDALRAIFNTPSNPKSPKEVGVRDKLDGLATNIFEDHFVHTNPVSLEDREHVLKLLEMSIKSFRVFSLRQHRDRNFCSGNNFQLKLRACKLIGRGEGQPASYIYTDLGFERSL